MKTTDINDTGWNHPAPGQSVRPLWEGLVLYQFDQEGAIDLRASHAYRILALRGKGRIRNGICGRNALLLSSGILIEDRGPTTLLVAPGEGHPLLLLLHDLSTPADAPPPLPDSSQSPVDTASDAGSEPLLASALEDTRTATNDRPPKVPVDGSPAPTSNESSDTDARCLDTALGHGDARDGDRQPDALSETETGTAPTPSTRTDVGLPRYSPPPLETSEPPLVAAKPLSSDDRDRPQVAPGPLRWKFPPRNFLP